MPNFKILIFYFFLLFILHWIVVYLLGSELDASHCTALQNTNWLLVNRLNWDLPCQYKLTNRSPFTRYCAKTPELKTCIYTLLDGVSPCLDPKAQEHMTLVKNGTNQLIDFVCYKDGDRIAREYKTWQNHNVYITLFILDMETIKWHNLPCEERKGVLDSYKLKSILFLNCPLRSKAAATVQHSPGLQNCLFSYIIDFSTVPHRNYQWVANRQFVKLEFEVGSTRTKHDDSPKNEYLHTLNNLDICFQCSSLKTDHSASRARSPSWGSAPTNSRTPSQASKPLETSPLR